MFQTVEEATQWISGWDTFSIKLGTERMEWMLKQLDHPERQCRIIHVAGTNGKGSTVAFLASILREAGYSVGTFTSPALEKFNDRISIDGQVISDEDLLDATNKIYKTVEALKDTEWGEPTEFEVITVLALTFFARIAYCDFTILEVGLGGRYDSTNIVNPLIGAITNVGMDHVLQLGPTLRHIAFEKAGIIKSGMPVVTAARGEALEVITETALQKQAKLYTLSKEFQIEQIQHVNDGEIFSLVTPFKRYESLKLSMFGTHQIENASLAVMMIDYLRTYYAVHVDEENVQQGLLHAFWPGRFEIVSKSPLVILDGAHNVDGMKALVHTIQEHYSSHRIKVLFASLKDKDNGTILQYLSELTNHIVFTSFDHYRAIDAESLSERAPVNIKKELVKDWVKAYNELKSSLVENELLLITGSLYFITEVRKHLNHIDGRL